MTRLLLVLLLVIINFSLDADKYILASLLLVVSTSLPLMILIALPDIVAK